MEDRAQIGYLLFLRLTRLNPAKVKILLRKWAIIAYLPHFVSIAKYKLFHSVDI
jgi:hypothetical protein